MSATAPSLEDLMRHAQIITRTDSRFSDLEPTDLIHSIPKATWLAYFEFLSQVSLNFMSVGSGIGIVESYVETQLNFQRPILGVDPAPGSYTHKVDGVGLSVIKKPIAATLDDFLSTRRRPTTLNLILIWPTPNSHEDGVDFDTDAIQRLKPEGLVILAGPDGSAGSTSLLAWLLIHPGYHKVAQCSSTLINDANLFRYPDVVQPTLYLFVRQDLAPLSVEVSSDAGLFGATSYYTDKHVSQLSKAFDSEAYLAAMSPHEAASAKISRMISLISYMGGRHSTGNES